MKNIISVYINFKKKKLYEICSLLIDDDTFIQYYIDTYILTYYYHILGRLDNVKKFDFQVVKKELEGTTMELLLENDNKDLIKKTEKIVLNGITLDRVEFLVDSLEEIGRGIKTLENKKLISAINDINSLSRIIKKYIVLENKFLNKLNTDSFSLNYLNYRDNFYEVNLEYNIKKLDDYNDIVLDKIIDMVYNEQSVALINLLSTDILKKMINQEDIGYYFIRCDNNIISMLDNLILKEHVILIIENKKYIKEGYKYALLVDFSHINDVGTKLDNLDEYPLKYIIASKVKRKDFDHINNYSYNDKELMIRVGD